MRCRSRLLFWLFCLLSLARFEVFALEPGESELRPESLLDSLEELSFRDTGDPLIDYASKRTWTSTDGRSLSAEIIAADETSGTFRLANGSTTPIPLSRLSEEDQKFIREWRALSEYFNLNYRPRRSLTTFLEAELFDGAFAKNGKIHETRNFRFECDVPLTASVVKDFSRLFEVTYLALENLPIAISPSETHGEKFLVKLFASKNDYYRAGGLENAAGIYIVADRVILVPIESLGLETRGSSGVVMRSGYDPRTLIHETVHAITHQWLEYQPMWIIEGLAEYVAAIPYKNGRLYLDRHQEGLRQQIVDSFGGDPTRFPLWDPNSLVSLTPEAFMNRPAVEERSINLPTIAPFQIELIDPVAEVASAEEDQSEMGGFKPMGFGGIKNISISMGGFAPQARPENVIQRYVSSMLLLDELMKPDDGKALRRFLFSQLHFQWEQRRYLKEFDSTHREHISAVEGQIAEFQAAIDAYNTDAKRYNEAIMAYNAGQNITIPAEPTVPEIPAPIPVPAILQSPRSAAELSVRSYREISPRSHFTIPDRLTLPE